VGERLYGLGSADAKVDFVCKAAALEGLAGSRLRRRVRLVGSFAEEIGLLGAQWLIDAGHVRDLRQALVGEPSELIAVHAHKGYAKFRARVACPPAPVVGRAGGAARWELSGVSAHSSTPGLGRNAIEAALERLAAPEVVGLVDIAGGGPVNKVPDRCRVELRLARGGEPVPPADALGVAPDAPGPPADALGVAPLLAFHRAWRAWQASLEQPRDPQFDPAHSVANLGRIARAGDAIELEFDVRPIPGSDARKLVAPLERVAELHCLRANPPLQTPIGAGLLHAVVSAQARVGLPQRTGTKGTCTEAGLLARAGLEAVVLGAGRSIGNVHRPNEYTLIPQLAQARDLYRCVVECLCGEAGSSGR
jgi:succinyl-diaminopimelate desuccinylase